jgi:Recombination enhancement, RecA-dependent nuclease
MSHLRAIPKPKRVEKPKQWITLRQCRPGKKPKPRRYGRALPAPTRAQQARQDAARAMGCIACLMRGLRGEDQCGRTEIHHQNLGGYAGQKQLGQDQTVALGAYHHQGVLLRGLGLADMARRFGPSLKRAPRAFRAAFGDDPELLAEQNKRLEGNA